MQVLAVSDPRAILADFNCPDAAETCEFAGLDIVRLSALEEGFDLIFIREDDVYSLFELRQNPVAGDVDDFEGREFQADRASRRAGRARNLVRQGWVEEQITFNVGMPGAAKIIEGDLVRAQRHGGAEVCAHCALTIGGDQGKAAAVGQGGALEARPISACGDKVGEVIIGGDIATDFAQISGPQAESRGTQGGVRGRTAGRDCELRSDLGHEGGDIVVIDEHHAAFFTGHMAGEKRFGDVRQQIHNGITDADEIKGLWGHEKCRVRGLTDGQVGGEDGVIVHLDEDGIFAGLVEAQIAQFVDEIDAVQGTLRFKFTLQQLGVVDRIEAQGYLDHVLARLHVREGEKPHHVRVDHRKRPRLDVGKHAKQGVFSRRWIDVHRIAGDPS